MKRVDFTKFLPQYEFSNLTLSRFSINPVILTKLGATEIIQLSFFARLNGGVRQNFKGWLILNGNRFSVGKGGIRFAPSVSKKEVEMLAKIMSLKCALLDLPYRGAKCGVVVDPRDYSPENLDLVMGSLADHLIDAGYLDSEFWIPAPDIGTYSQLMNTISAKYQEHFPDSNYQRIVTGKSLANGGIVGRASATGHGIQIIVDELFGSDNLKFNPLIGPLDGKRMIVHGFGNVGSHAARYLLNENGIKIIAIGEWDGALFNQQGLSVQNVLAYKQETGGVKGFPDAEYLPNSQYILNMETDILLLSATENVITSKNANQVKAKIIIEGANGPITAKANSKLKAKRVLVVPDILANAGGVYVSHLEAIKNKFQNEDLFRDHIKENELLKFDVSHTGMNELALVSGALETRMRKSFHKVIDTWRLHLDVDMRTAAFVTAIEQLAKK